VTQKSQSPPPPLDPIETRAERAMKEASRRRDEAIAQLREKHLESVRARLQPPNWATKWCHVVKVTIEEAVALSLGWEPMQSELAQLPEYHERMFVAQRNAGSTLSLVATSPGVPTGRLCVELRCFVDWVRNLGWTLPADLLKATETSCDESSQKEAPSRPKVSNREIDRVIAASEKLSANGESWTVRALSKESGVTRPKVDAMCVSGCLPDALASELTKRRRRKSVGR
jgi:hypothetical protein